MTTATPSLLPVLWRPQVDSVYEMDALALMRAMPPGSVDAIITDLPYQVTGLKWDTIVPFVPMWEAVKRVLKPSGVFVTTATQPFTSALIMSNPDWFKCEWIWNKRLSGNFLVAANQPLKIHENIIVFSGDSSSYYPQMEKGIRRLKGGGISNLWSLSLTATISDEYYPKSIIQVSNTDRSNTLHPTQKPVALFSYLIRTYTQPGDLVLDPFVGSGTTALAARNEGRHFIVGDQSEEYCNVARERLRQPYERHYITPDNDVTTLPVAEGYDRHLFAESEAV